MAERGKIKTTKQQIVDYWAAHVDECDLSVDFAEAHERCWRCGGIISIHDAECSECQYRLRD